MMCLETIGTAAVHTLERADEVVMLSTPPYVDGPAHVERREHFAVTISEVLRLGWLGHYSSGKSVLLALQDRLPLSRGERALCRGLLALIHVALDDIASARRLARQAISDSARPPNRTPAGELRWLRLARALASNASTLVGDVVRGRRAAQAMFMLNDDESGWLICARAESPWLEAPATVQRYARLIAAVHERYAMRSRGPLTPAELVIIGHIEAGLNAPRIAELLGRSPHTVRTHLRNASVRLGAHGRADALVKARALGLLDGSGRRAGPPRG